MKIVYLIVSFASFIALMVIYFSNLLIVGNYTMFLGSKNNIVSVAEGLVIVIFFSFILGVSVALYFKSLGKNKVKDFDDFDL